MRTAPWGLGGLSAMAALPTSSCWGKQNPLAAIRLGAPFDGRQPCMALKIAGEAMTSPEESR